MWNFAFVLPKLILFFPPGSFLPFVTVVGFRGHPGVLEQNRLLWRIPGLSLLGSLRFLRAALEVVSQPLASSGPDCWKAIPGYQLWLSKVTFCPITMSPRLCIPFIPMSDGRELPLECLSLCVSVTSSEGLWSYWDLLSSLGSSWSSVWGWGWVGSASLQDVPLLLQGLL